MHMYIAEYDHEAVMASGRAIFRKMNCGSELTPSFLRLYSFVAI